MRAGLTLFDSLPSKEDSSMMTYGTKPVHTRPVTDLGMSRAFVRMLSAAVESGDDVDALKIVRGAEVHFEWLVANPEKVTR
jgi:hypothetical protein